MDFLGLHRRVWSARPELRSVYRQFFDQLTAATGDRNPVIEFGAGPGFFKEYLPSLISTDIITTNWVDVVCDGCTMPFKHNSVGAIVMLDVLHHLAKPISFMKEAARVLQPGGTIAMIEPWITPTSYLFYKYLHHEDCTLRINVDSPFDSTGKKAFDGNATIPYNLVRHYTNSSDFSLRLVRLKPFLALPYIATLGFKHSQPMPNGLIKLAEACERILGPVGYWNATRALLLWEKQA